MATPPLPDNIFVAAVQVSLRDQSSCPWMVGLGEAMSPECSTAVAGSKGTLTCQCGRL